MEPTFKSVARQHHSHLVQAVSDTIEMGAANLEQSMKIREQGHCALENRYRRGAHLNGPLGAPGGAPKRRFRAAESHF